MEFALPRDVAIESVNSSAKILVDKFEKLKLCSFKSKSDIVTEVDLEVEKFLVSRIQKNFPDHDILSEEMGSLQNGSRFLWIIDPIDGTMNYYHSSSPFRIGVCFLIDQQPVLSVISNPLKNDMFVSEKGKGSTLNDKPISVNDNEELKNSIVMTHISSKKEARARTILALNQIFNNTLHMRMFGSGLAAMTYVATGKFDVFFNLVTNPWDILPGALLIEEAGGTVTDVLGNPITETSTSVLATNGKVHQDMLELLVDV